MFSVINRKKEWVFQIWLQVSGAPTWLWVLVASAARHTQGLLFLLLLLLQFLTVFEGNKSRSSTSGWNPRSSALLPLRPGRGAPKKTEDKKKISVAVSWRPSCETMTGPLLEGVRPEKIGGAGGAWSWTWGPTHFLCCILYLIIILITFTLYLK